MIQAQVEGMMKRGKELKAREEELESKAERDKKKRPVVRELVETEKGYNANVKDMLLHYLKPLQENLLSLSPVVTSSDLDTIFQNVEDLMGHSDALLQELSQDEVSSELRVGPVLERSMRHVGVYRQYVTRLDGG
eukprot:CAMPEP_0173468002 /NCGR_PEP_ID=MMETSP1357-20121228/76095_1 /TAXON_ID=77926 /ORGANISM="Hemiselmis rufescens, Strain PCC563" /LENGTH=134 /DNA_ID=CAMNT_0014436185 /DNA_START=9 /DNA_END=409 /DNA_ORIENTATION=+